MQRRRLGKSGLYVSEIGLGTMTFGTQSSREESFRIMDCALDGGINFFDTAEIYPVPPSGELAGRTEEWIGAWLKGRKREEILLATKCAGPAHGWFDPPVRYGNAAIDGFQIRRAVEGSLRRLCTDYIDLYQIHWPDHGMRAEDTLVALNALVEEGKIRALGCSNETSYGLVKSLWEAEKRGLRRFDTIQNNFSINHRRFEDELKEVCLREGVSLLPYSPLAGGVLTGKYNAESMPQDARFYDYFHSGKARQKAMAERFVNPKTLALTQCVAAIAREADLDPTTLAVAWSKQHPYVASTLIGVSDASQLAPILEAADLILSSEVLHAIDLECSKNLYPMG